MNKKVIALNEQRRKKKPRPLVQVTDMAVRRYFDPNVLAETTEPLHFAEGKLSPDGSFIDDADAGDNISTQLKDKNHDK